MTLRVVFDTTTVVSALLFANGRLAWLRRHWREGECVPLLSAATAAELTRVLDLSYGAAQKLDMVKPGVAPVDIEIVALGHGKP